MLLAHRLGIRCTRKFPQAATFLKIPSMGASQSSHSTAVRDIPSMFDEKAVPAVNLVVCNGRVCPSQLDFFIRRATNVVCADGGAMTLEKHICGRDCDTKADILQRTTVVGDFDSVSDDVLEIFRAKGAVIQQIVDQDRNDLEKALGLLVYVAPPLSSMCATTADSSCAGVVFLTLRSPSFDGCMLLVGRESKELAPTVVLGAMGTWRGSHTFILVLAWAWLLEDNTDTAGLNTVFVWHSLLDNQEVVWITTWAT